MDLQLAIAHLVVVQQIVHQTGQAVCTLDDEPELLLLPFGQILLAGEHRLGHPLDAVNGGAQLVGGVGQQFILELVRLLQAEVLLVGQLDLLLQLLGLLFDQFDLVLHRALHMAKRLGQPVDIIAGALDGDGVIQRAVGHLLGCFGQRSQRRRDGVGEPAGEEDQQQYRARSQHNHQGFQLADRGIGFPGRDLGDKGPLGIEHLHLGVGGQHLVILIGVEQPDPLLAGERLGDEGRLQWTEVGAEAVLYAELRCQPGIGAHPLVRADQDGLAGLAQPLPLRHDLVELVRQQLENHHPAHIVVLHHGCRHVGDHLPGQLVAAKIGEFEDLLRLLAAI